MAKKIGMATTKREDVFKLIDGERKYQNALPYHSSYIDHDRSVAEWLLLIEHYLNKAKFSLFKMDEISSLDDIRKLAALAVACMEHNKTYPR